MDKRQGFQNKSDKEEVLSVYSGKNPSALRSQNMLAHAFLDLLQEEDFEDVTVTMICQRAQVARQTFYNVFDSQEDVVRYLIFEVYRAFEQQILEHDVISFQMFSRETFRCFEKNSALVDVLIRNNMTGILQEELQCYLKRILSRFHCASEELNEPANQAFITGGLCAMAIQCATDHDALDPETRAEHFATLFNIGDFVRIDEPILCHL